MRTRQLHRGRLPLKIIDYLTTHGGWHTTGALAALSDCKKPLFNHPVQRALLRLRDDGLIEGRPSSPKVGRGTPQHEWRATEEAEQWL